MSARRVFGGLVAGGLLVASCARTDVPPAAPAPSAVHEADAGAIAVPNASPVADRDHDGVPDDVDRCPDDPEDCDGFEDTDGCFEADNDEDGRPDYCDECPDRAAQTYNGCPRMILEGETIVIPIAATFAIDGVKPSIRDEDLAPVVELAKSDRLKRLGIVGHALTTEKSPESLELRRAAATKKLLLSRGVPAAKIELRAAQPGDLERCPPAKAGAPQPPCASFVPVELDGRRMTWDGERYFDPPPPSPPPLPCPDPPPRGPGHPCTQP
jgi:hypothetical protein